MGAVNGDGDRLPGSQMGLSTAGWYSTGAAGSDSGNTAAAAAPELARVGVAPGNWADSPLARPRDMTTVSVGDTFSGSSDQPYGTDGREDVSGVRLDYGGSGQFQPGSGRVAGARHPNAGSTPS